MERPFDHSGMSEPDGFDVDDFRLADCDPLHRYTGELGDRLMTIRVWLAPEWWTRENIEHAVDWHMEPEYCHHSHDCCGHWYGGGGKIIDTDHSTDKNGERCIAVTVRRDYRMNI